MQQIDTVTRRVTTRFGHERQRHDLIGGSETRTVGARRVLDTYIFQCGCSQTGVQLSPVHVL